MSEIREIEERFVGAIDMEQRRYAVTVEIAFDGVEHIGHLRFANDDWEDDEGIADHVGIPGRSANEILVAAQALTREDLLQRYERAQTTTRRFHGLRRATDDVLALIRYLNKVSTSLRAGLLDIDDAAREIDSTEQQLVDRVRQLRGYAGVAA
ncbi:MAG TPA: hypothetical protein VJ717_20930 [Gemmatimonadaceae bacterium]|nr:hypothetical protein [Gemmatimonadaceae bacterium]